MAILNGIAKVSMVSHLGSGQTIVNTVHIAKAGLGTPPTITQLSDLAAQWSTYFAPTYEALLTTQDTFDRIQVSQVPDPAAPTAPLEAVQLVNAGGGRTPGGAQVPDSLCAVLSLKTTIASRRFRGHLFMPPVINNASVASGNNVGTSGAYYTALSNFAARLATGGTLAPTWTGAELSTWVLVVYSRVAAAAALAYDTPVFAVTISPKFHWLRSRERGA